MLQIYEKISGHNAFLRFENSLLMHSQNDNTGVLRVFSPKKWVTTFISKGEKLVKDIPFEILTSYNGFILVLGWRPVVY